MMTTMAALFGALPLALGHGTGSELRRPLGIAVAGGLILSQILTLYTTPVIYLFLDRLRLRFQSHGNAGAVAAQRRDNLMKDPMQHPPRRVSRVQSQPAKLLQSDLSFLLSVICGLMGCNVGPRYIRPVVPAPPAFKESGPQQAAGWQHLEACAAARCQRFAGSGGRSIKNPN